MIDFILRNRYNIGAMLFLTFCLFVDLRLFIYKETFFAYFSLLVAILLCTHKNARLSTWEKYWILCGLFIFTGKLGNYIVMYTIALVFMYFIKAKIHKETFILKYICCVILIHALVTIICYYIPQIFTLYIYPHIDSAVKEMASHSWASNHPSGLSAHYSSNGMYLALGLGASFILGFYKQNRLIYWSIAVIILMALLLCGKRAHLGMPIVSIFLLMQLHQYKNLKKRIVYLILGVSFLGGVFWVVHAYFPDFTNTFNRFIETAESGDFTMSRELFIRKSLTEFNRSPIIGIGWGNISKVIHHDAHNVYIQLITETGIIGFALFMGIFYHGMSRSIKLYLAVRQKKIIVSTAQEIMLAFSVFYQSFFLMYCLTGNPLYDEQCFYPYILSYAIILYYDIHPKRKRYAKNRHHHLSQCH